MPMLLRRHVIRKLINFFNGVAFLFMKLYHRSLDLDLVDLESN